VLHGFLPMRVQGTRLDSTMVSTTSLCGLFIKVPGHMDAHHKSDAVYD